MIVQKNNTHVWIWEIHASFLFFYNGHVHDLGVFWLLSLVKSQDSYFFKKKHFMCLSVFLNVCVCAKLGPHASRGRQEGRNVYQMPWD